jgi:hypothetical protein
MFKSKKDFFSFYFALIIFIIALMVIVASVKSLLPDNDIAMIPKEVMMAILSAALAGVFTIIGVEKTLGDQNKSKFISEFPFKISHLDNMLEEIESLKKELYFKNAPFLILKGNYIQSLISTSTQVDGYIYFQTREAHIKFSSIIKEMFDLRKSKLFNRSIHGEYSINYEKKEEIQAKIDQLMGLVEGYERLVSEYREDFIINYDKNLTGTKLIFKKIRG